MSRTTNGQYDNIQCKIFEILQICKSLITNVNKALTLNIFYS